MRGARRPKAGLLERRSPSGDAATADGDVLRTGDEVDGPVPVLHKVARRRGRTADVVESDRGDRQVVRGAVHHDDGNGQCGRRREVLVRPTTDEDDAVDPSLGEVLEIVRFLGRVVRGRPMRTAKP